MCEDDYSELWRRQVSINQHYQITMQDLANVRMISRVCKDNLLIKFDSNNNAYPTKFFNNLYSDILKYKPDLVVLDTAADLFAGNENNRPQVRQFIQNICGRIAQGIDGSVLLCAHPSESGMQKGNGSCGSTAWNNTVRSRWYLKQSDNAAERILSRVKFNYATSGEEKNISWQNGAFIDIGSKSPVKSVDTAKTAVILSLIESEALKGKIYTMNQFATAFENKQGLGSKRNIRHKLTTFANSNLIKFFKEPRIYGLDISSSSYGYICTDNTKIRTGDKHTKVLATHYKSNNCGNLIKLDRKSGDEND